MTRVFCLLRRLYATTPFDGEGAFRYGGRWSSVGTRIAYASQHESLAMLEYFVHLDLDDPPGDLVLAMADVPDDIRRQAMQINALLPNWRQTPPPPELSVIGDNFIREAQIAILLVPSALATSEYNWLLNPGHPDFRRIVIHPVQQFRYDQRILPKGK